MLPCGDLKVDVGVGGEVVRPAAGPGAGPDAGQTRWQDAAGADEEVAAGVVHPLQQCQVEGGGGAVLTGDQLSGGQLAVGGGDVQVDAGAVVHLLVQCGVAAQKGGVVGGQAGEGGLQRLGVPAGGGLVPAELGQQQHLGGLGDDECLPAGGDRGVGAGDDDPGDALVAVRALSGGVGAAQVQVAVAARDRGGGGEGDAGRDAVEGGVDAEGGVDGAAGGGQQFVDDDLVGAGDEDVALPGAVGVGPGVGDFTGAEVRDAGEVVDRRHARRTQLQLVAGVEGLCPPQAPAVGECRGRPGVVTGQCLVPG